MTDGARIGYEKADEIVRIIVNNERAEGLLKLYLLDSIVKNIGGSYLGLFSEVLVEMYKLIFLTADATIRKKMFDLRQTWNSVFSTSTLLSIDIGMNEMDSNWPVQVSKNIFLRKSLRVLFSLKIDRFKTNCFYHSIFSLRIQFLPSQS